VSDVGLDGRLGQHETLSDLTITHPLGQKRENLALAWAELHERIARRAGAARELPQHSPGHTLGDMRLPVPGIEHRLHEFRRRHVLQQVACRAHAQSGPHVRLVL
jgi:hypothetical protein